MVFTDFRRKQMLEIKVICTYEDSNVFNFDQYDAGVRV
jgi:hypothetical protein